MKGKRTRGTGIPLRTVTKYGGNNYRIYACMFPRSFGEACIGPWHIPWFQGEENQRPPRPASRVLPDLPTDLSRINDIVSWRYDGMARYKKREC